MANLLSGTRIIMGMTMLFFSPHSIPFLVLYLGCGISDILDGWVARKTKTESELGARLDTVGDIAFLFASLLKIYPLLSLDLWILSGILIVALVKISTILYGYVSQKRFVAVHSKLNKATGCALFLYPLVLSFPFSRFIPPFLLSLALVSALDEGRRVWKDIKRQ